MIVTLLIAFGLVLCIAAVRLLRMHPTAQTVGALTKGFIAFNVLIAVAMVAFVLLALLSPPGSAFALALQQTPATSSNRGLAAAISTGTAAIGAGIAVGLTGAAAVGAIAEKPEMFGRTLVFVGLSEGIAIYGLIVAFIILTGVFGG